MRGFTKLSNKFVRIITGLVLVFAQMTPMVLLNTDSAAAAVMCTVDQQGANDQPGQKDLSRMCLDNANLPVSVDVTWNWDETGWPGGNTGDACALFDTNSNGFANYAVCVQVQNNPAVQAAGSPFVYTCNDTRVDRCAGDSLVAGPYATTCSVSITSSDPFPAGSANPNDTTASCTVVLSDVGGGGVSQLIDVCSVPSGQPNSDPSDCIIFVDKSIKVEVQKVLDPVIDPGLFDLKINGVTYADDVGSGGTTGEQVIISTGNSASITVLEAEGPATDLAAYNTAVVCRDGNGTGAILGQASPTGNDTRQLTVNNIAFGSDVVCVFTNTLRLGELVVVKELNQQWGGNETNSDFSFSVNGDSSLQFEADGSNTLLLPVGQQYSVVEDAAPGYTTTYDNCTNLTLVEGQQQICTITNTDQPVTLTVNKTVVNDNGGSATAGDFNALVNNSMSTPFVEDNPTTTGSVEYQLPRGTYTIGESGVNGYTPSYSGQCSDVTLDNGESAVCNITNDDQQGTLLVKKVLVQDNGGQDAVTSFGFSINGGNSVGFEADGENSFDVNQGTYTVVEDVAQGYTTTYDNCSDVAIPNGGSATCTITNDDQPGFVTVYKHVINDHNGPLEIEDFALYVSGTAGTTYVQSGIQILLDAGQYTVGEDSQLPAYMLSSITGDCAANGALTVALGGTYSCTLTNDDQPAIIRVHKSVTNDDGGVKDAEDFQFTVNGLNQQNFASAGNYVELSVSAGTYTIEETPGTEYAVNYDNCEDITALNGEVYNCYVSNDDKPATLIVEKDLTTDDGGTETVSDFSFKVNSGNSVNFEADGSNSFTVNAGTYSVVEDTAQGYTTTYDNCSDVTIPNGGSATCTITNDDQPGTLIVNKILTQDNGATESVADFSFRINSNDSVNFEADGSNSFTVNAGTYSVVEDTAQGYTTTYDNCSDVTIPNGGSATCTITNDDQPAKISIVKYAEPCDTDQMFDFTISQSNLVAGELTQPAMCQYNEFLSSTLIQSVLQLDVYVPQYVEVDKGEVTVTERVPDGWFQDSMYCYRQLAQFRDYFSVVDGSFDVVNGGEYVCEFTNIEYGEIVITKYHDYNQNGAWDEGEPTLSDWEMCTAYLSDGPFIEDVCGADWFADQQTTNSDGKAVFTDVRPGAHVVAEVLQDGWVQSSIECEFPKLVIKRVSESVSIQQVGDDVMPDIPNNIAFVPAGESTDCYIGNYREPSVDIIKSNNAGGPVQRGTEIEFTLTVTVPGFDESGNLQGTTDDGAYLPVTVTDNLQDEFEYVAGSFKAVSSNRGDLVAAGITTDPNYASPGTWVLTSQASNIMSPGEIVTLTYRAVVGAKTPAGTYPTVASVVGYGDDSSVVVRDDATDQVTVTVPAVLGVSTPEKRLAVTGSESSTSVFVGILLIASVLYLRRKNSSLQI